MSEQIFRLDDPAFQEAMARKLAEANQPDEPPAWVEEKTKMGRPFGKEKYPFSTLEVGKTFQVEAGQHQPLWNSFRIYCHKKGKLLGRVFRCHRYPDGTFEVWRQS